MSGQSKDEESPENDVWDDSLLIQSYDKSVRLAKKALAKKIAQATNKNNKKESSETNDMGHQASQEPVAQNSCFKVGDYVRATYDDGIDYEAKIVSIDESSQDCLLKYIGYENEQSVKLTDLIQSWGKKARKKQFDEAKKRERQDGGEVNREPNVPVAMFGRLPPPPPMPPNLSGEDSEHLSAMLMSWYMSGYYTGYYHGQRMQKTSRKK